MMRRSMLPAVRPWRGGLNLTPLVDISFQLIVFFLLVSQVVTAERGAMELPHPFDSQSQRDDKLNRMVINLFADADGKLDKMKVNANVVHNLPDLVDMLLRCIPQASAQGTSVILRADKRLQFDQVQPVLKALSNASVGSLQIATEYPDGGSAVTD